MILGLPTWHLLDLSPWSNIFFLGAEYHGTMCFSFTPFTQTTIQFKILIPLPHSPFSNKTLFIALMGMDEQIEKSLLVKAEGMSLLKDLKETE